MTGKEIEVQILGKNFNFNVPDSIRPEEFLEIIDYVETTYLTIKKEMGDLDSFKMGLLASINIAEKYLFLKKENDRFSAVFSNIDRMVSLDVSQDERSPIRFSS